MNRVVAIGLGAGLLVASACKTVEPIRDQPPAADTQDTSELGDAARLWASQPQPASMIEFFNGSFDTMAVTVEETEETFTVRHTGERFEFVPGLLEDASFKVSLREENIKSIVAFVQDGALDGAEATQIMAVLFTPMSQVILNHPVTNDPDLREKSGLEEIIHTYLVDAAGEAVAVHTMRYENELWTVTPGAEGAPKRVFRINAAQAVDYQRHAFAAVQTNSPLGWLSFIKWYREWREGCSTVPKD